MSSVNRVVNAMDYAARDGAASVRELIKRWSGRMYQRGLLDTPFVDSAATGAAVIAEVNHGQWIARCDQCGTPMWVAQSEPMFYCFGCGNQLTGGVPRPVTFPEDWEVIEGLLLERPVDDRKGTNDIDRAFLAFPLAIGAVDGQLVALNRSWTPDESAEDLETQNAMIADLLQTKEGLGMIASATEMRAAYTNAIAYFAEEADLQKQLSKNQQGGS